MTGSLGPLLPVLVIEDPAVAGPLASALLAGGISQAEVTLRTPAAIEAIRSMSRIAGFTVGAGTVTDPEQADAATAAGASFLVSPNWDLGLAHHVHSHGFTWIPGVATPSEAFAARANGFRRIKLFPISLLGGVDFIDALTAVLPDVAFVPSGGIRPEDAREYLSRESVEAIGGSWMVSRELLASGDFAAITATCRASVEETL